MSSQSSFQDKLNLLRNVKHVATIHLVAKVLTIATGIVLARILDPNEFGVYGIAVSIMALLALLGDTGWKAATLQSNADDFELTCSTGFVCKFASSVVIFVVTTFLVAPAMADFYDVGDIRIILPVIAFAMIIDTLAFVPDVRLVRNNNLSLLVGPTVASAFTYSTLVITLASMGFSYWSFVWSHLISRIVFVAFLAFKSPFSLSFRFERKRCISLLHFGKFVFVSALLSMLIRQMDNMVAAKMLGMAALGYYAMAYRWGSVITMDIGKVLNQALYPLNLKYRNDIKKLNRLHVRVSRYIPVLIFPLAFGFISVCPEFVRGVLGAKWEPAILPLQILAFHGLLAALMKQGEIFTALGKPQYGALLSGLSVITLAITLVPMTSRWGIAGTALAVCCTYFLVGFVGIWVILARNYSFEWRKILANYAVPLAPSLAMFTAIACMRVALAPLAIPQLGLLFLFIVEGVIIYAAALFLLRGDELRQIIAVIRSNGLSFNNALKQIAVNL